MNGTSKNLLRRQSAAKGSARNLAGRKSFDIVAIVLIVLLGCYFLAIIGTALLSLDFSAVHLSSRLFHPIAISIISAAVSATIAVVIAIPVAYLLARKTFPGKALVDTLLDLPTVLSPVALGTCLLLLFSSDPGKWFEKHVLEITYAIPGIIVAQATVVVALAIRSLKATIEEIDPRFEAMARVMGYGRGETVRRIVLPLARNGILATLIICFGRAIGEFGVTITLVGAIPGKTETLPAAIYLGLEATHIDDTLIAILILIAVAFSALSLIRALGGKMA